jgi:hypothetical protein
MRKHYIPHPPTCLWIMWYSSSQWDGSRSCCRAFWENSPKELEPVELWGGPTLSSWAETWGSMKKLQSHHDLRQVHIHTLSHQGETEEEAGSNGLLMLLDLHVSHYRCLNRWEKQTPNLFMPQLLKFPSPQWNAIPSLLLTPMRPFCSKVTSLGISLLIC